MVGDDTSVFFASQHKLPSNPEAEVALLGAILANNSAYHRVSSFLQPEHFCDTTAGRVYQAIAQRIEAGQLADAVTLKGEFGSEYLAHLMASMVAINTAGDYGRVVHDCWLRRQLIEAGESVISNARGADPDLNGTAQVYAAQDRLALLLDGLDTAEEHHRPMSIGEAVSSAVERAGAIYRGEATAGLSTGLPAFDRIIGGGFQPATLTYLAGLGEVGKTAMALQIAESVARTQMRHWQGQRERAGEAVGPCPGVLMFSFDMTSRQIGIRTAARLSGLSPSVIRNGQLDDQVCRALMRAEGEAMQLPIEIDDAEPYTLARVCSRIAQFCRIRPCALAIIDNLSKIVGEGKVDALFPAFLHATSTLKKLVNRLNIPAMLLVHLPQTVAKRDNPMPRRGDLPYGIHMHADFAIGQWRPELALAQSPPERGRMKEEAHQELVEKWHRRKEALRGVCELVPLKIREDDGGGRPATLLFDTHTSQFTDPQDAAL